MAGADVFGLGCCAETETIATVVSATEANKRTIFITFLYYSLLKRGSDKLLSCKSLHPGWLEQLKGTSYAESEDGLFLIEEKGKTINNLIFPGIRIIRKDQSERYIDDGYLDTHFHSQA